MSLTLRFLGTAASRPTVERNVVSLAVLREGEAFLFDCGEGTQRQMMRYGITFNVDDVFFSHFHADHYLGIIGLLQTMALQGRTAGIRLWGPRGAQRVLGRALSLDGGRMALPVEIGELAPGEAVEREAYRVVAFPTEHRGTAATGWLLEEHERKGRFNPERARELGVPEGPLWGQIHRGLAVTLPDGRIVEPAQLVGAPRPGRRLVYSGDTRPCTATIEAARDADVLVHEATFADEDAARAAETGHATAREAAEVAALAGARRLVLTHLSARYSRDTGDLEREARARFPGAIVARDGLELDVPYRDAAAAS